MSGNRTRIVAAVALFVCALALFRHAIGFPYFAHPDEAGKAEQVISGERNFHHPLLLLESTAAFVKLLHVPPDLQAVTEAGRAVSAAFAAAAVVMFAWLASRLAGLAAGALAAALVLTHPVLFEAAHYLKEDCAFLAGVAACFLALRAWSERPTLAMAAVCGAAAGLCASGKYMGLTVAGAGLIVLLCTRGHARRGSAPVYLGVGVLVFALINRDALLATAQAAQGLGSEFDQIGDPKRSDFRFRYGSAFGTSFSVPVLLALGWWLWRHWQTRREEGAFKWVLLAFPFAFTAGLSFAPVAKERYLLPAFMLACVLAAAALVEMWRAARGRWRWVAVMLIIAAAVWNLPELTVQLRDYQRDSRLEMIAWIREHLPPEAKIAGDDHTKLDEARASAAFTFAPAVKVKGRYAADLATLDELRARGFTHVAVCEQDYYAVFKDLGRRKAEEARRREFYERLFREGERLWSVPPGHLKYLHPGLAIYSLPTARRGK